MEVAITVEPKKELDAAEIVGDDPRVDILTVAWDVSYEQAEPSREERTILSVRVPYLSRDDLIIIRSKQTGRPGDLADIEALSPDVGDEPCEFDSAALRDIFLDIHLWPSGSWP